MTHLPLSGFQRTVGEFGAWGEIPTEIGPYRNQKVNSMVLGGMWQPSAPVEQEFEGEAWNELRERHQDAVPAQYNQECLEEEWGPEECLEEYAIPEANWIELIDNEGAAAAFDIQGGSYVTPEYMKEYVLISEGSGGGKTFTLADPNGVRTVFVKNEVGIEGSYRPKSVSWQATEKSARMVYQHVEGTGEYRLIKMIAPAPSGVSCTDEGATHTAGCRVLTFQYFSCSCGGWQRLSSITYYNGSGQESSSQVVAKYEYDSHYRLIAEWDPRISPNLKETYYYGDWEYDPRYKMESLTPPGEEPWEFAYESSELRRLTSVSRASLLENPSTATSTIAYNVPLYGEGAPYEMSPNAVAEWGQSDYPVDATAIFPPDQVPAGTPSDYSHAIIHYLDPDGYEVNTASAAPPGEGDAITTTETDRHGNVVRELSAQNRLAALKDADPAVRAAELDTHSTYNTDGTRMLQSWAPLHEVRLENGETAEARAHIEVEYDKGYDPAEGEVPPNLPTKETSGAAIPGQEADQDIRVSETKYDWSLRKPTETIVDPEGLDLVAKTAYNSAGQVVEERQPSDEAGKTAGTSKTIYYVAGELTGLTQEEVDNFSSCAFKPEWAGLPCATYPVADPSPSETNPKLPVTTFASYSPLDQPEETQEKTNGTLKRTTTIEYDSAGRPITTHQTGEGTEVPAVETIYDEETGRPVSQQFVCETKCEGFDSQQLTTTYDKLGRPVEYEDADGNVSGVGYDLLGRPVVTSDGKGVQEISYDEESGVVTKMTDSAAGTFQATYNADGQMTEQLLPNGLAQKVSYDPAGTAVSLSYEKQTFCASACTWLSFAREDSIGGQVLREESTLGDHEYAYDKAGRLTLAEEFDLGGECTTRSYAFDKDSNRASMTTRDPKEGGACDTESEGSKTSYTYDTADRLLGEGVEYDNLGRITSLPAKYSGGGKLETSYFVNDLTQSQTQDGITNTYELDAMLRQRERIREGGSEEGTAIYHYAGGGDSPAWTEELGEGEPTWTRSIGALGGSLGALQTSSGEVTLQLADMHGDTIATADIDPEATELLDTQSFDEYGNPLQSGFLAGGNPEYGWLGARSRRTQLPSGVVQMGVRSYVPSLGRFLSPDPVPGGSANAYEYAAGDPVNNVDLTGETCGGRCKQIRRLNRRSRRMARQHKLRRLARGRRRGARASSFILAPLATRLGRDVADKAGYVAGKLADMAFRRAKQAAEDQVESKAAMVRYIMSGMNKLGNWAWAHRRQIHSCAYNAAAGYMEARYLALGGPDGAAALGLYMAVKCGIGFL